MDADRVSQRRASWQKHFRDGLVWSLPVDHGQVRRFLRGNTAVLVGACAALVIAVGLVVALLAVGEVPAVIFILLGVFVLAMVFVLRLIRKTRKRLRAATTSPDYVTVSSGGLRVGAALDVPWADVIGILVTDTRGARRGFARTSWLAAPIARSSGIAEVEVLLGLRSGAAGRLRDAADPRLRVLFEVIGDTGGLRLPLDRALTAEAVDRLIAGLDGLAPTLPVGFALSDGSTGFFATVDLFSGTPLPVDEHAVAEARANAEKPGGGDVPPAPTV